MTKRSTLSQPKIPQALVIIAATCWILVSAAPARAAEDNTKEIAQAAALSAKGQKYEALKILSAVIARSPNDGIARLNRADILYPAARYDLALQDAKVAAQKDPKNQHAFYLVGLCEDRLNHPQEALKWFDKTLTLPGIDLNIIRRDKAMALLKSNKPDEARAVILQAMKIDKTGKEAEKNSDLFILESIDRVIIRRPLLDPNSKDATLMAKADALHDKKKDVESLQVVELILSHDPNNVAAHELKGDILRDVEDAKSVAEMKIVVSAHPNYQHAYAVMAEILARLKQYPEALAAADRALKIGGPDQGSAHRFKSFALLYMHRFKEARAETDEALKLHPFGTERHSDIMNRMDLDRIMKDYPALLADSDERLKMGLYKKSYDWVYRGKAYLLLGKTDEAIHDFQKACSLTDTDRDAYSGLAEAYAKKGDKVKEEKARAAMKALDFDYASDKERSSRPDLKPLKSADTLEKW
jgi:tetratricopeptide (TPR) repeat protein